MKKNESRNYSKHLQQIQSCSNSWVILEKNCFDKQNNSSNSSRFKVVPVRCKSKSCKYCLSLEIKKIRRKLYNIPKLHNLRFFTLTTKNDSRPDEEKLKSLVISFRKLTLLLRKDFPKIKYFYIIERSKNGFWHIHGLWNVFIPVVDLSAKWKKVSGAYRVHLSKVKSERGIVRYIADYLTKSGINRDEKKVFYETNKRQYNSSRGFFEKDNYKSSYNLYSNEVYRPEELKKVLFVLIEKNQLYRSDIEIFNYPFYNSLLDNIYHSIYCECDQQSVLLDDPGN